MAVDEQEIGRLMVRLVGDASQLIKALSQAETATKTAEEGIKKSAGGAEKSFHVSTRGVHVLSNSLNQLANTKGPENALLSMSHLAYGLGHQFGMTGILIAAGVGVAITAIVKLNDFYKDLWKTSVVSANEAFGAIIDGSKSAQKALGDVGLDKFHQRLKDAQQVVSPTGFLEDTWNFLKSIPSDLAAGKVQSRSEIARQDMVKASKELYNARAEFQRQLHSSLGEAFQRTAGKANADATIAQLKDELALRNKMIGVSNDLRKIEEARQKLRGAGVSPFASQFKELDQLKQSTGMVAFKEFEESMRKIRHDAGMTANEAHAIDLRMQGVNEKSVQVALNLAKWADNVQKAKSLLKSLTEEAQNRGKSSIEAVASLPFIDLDLTAKLRKMEQDKLVFNLSKEWDKFAAAQGGATKAQLAFLAAADPVAAVLARNKSLIEEGMRVTEQYATPQEKFNSTYREMSELLRAGTIDQDTYNRALADAQKKLDGVAEKTQAVGVNSAEALSHLLDYQDMLSGTKNVPTALPSGGTGATLAGSPEALQKARDQLEVLKQIRDAVKAKPAAMTLLPAGL